MLEIIIKGVRAFDVLVVELLVRLVVVSQEKQAQEEEHKAEMDARRLEMGEMGNRRPTLHAL